MQLNPNLAFNGNAEEVLDHYRNVIGAADVRERRSELRSTAVDAA